MKKTIAILILVIGCMGMNAQDRAKVEKKARFEGVGYVGIGAMPIPYPTASLSLGVMLNDKVFVGGGVGITMMMSRYHDADPDNRSLWVMPFPKVYLQTDVFLKEGKRVRPYFTLSGGWDFPLYGYVQAGFGIDKQSFVWQLCYKPNFIKDGDYLIVVHGITFDFGYRFKTAKYYRSRRGKQ